MGILMEDPSSPRFPLNHPLCSQSDETPPSITTHPYRPTAESNVVPHQVRTLSRLVTRSLLSLSDHFHIDTFMITLIHFRPPAFLLLSFHFIFLTHSLWPRTYPSTARQALPLIISHFVITIWPSLFTPYPGSFRSACHNSHILFLDIPNSSHNIHFLLFHLMLGILALVDTFSHASCKNCYS